jgi:phage gpG-like protein
MIMTIDIDNKTFMQKLFQLQGLSNDLRPVFETIISDFYKGNDALTFSGRPGKYADLKPSTKASKMRKVGFIYPILVSSGRLKNSLIKRDGRDNITKTSPKELLLGTQVPYATPLQTGNKNGNKMPARPPLLINVGGRLQRWIRILNEAIAREVSK